jgi:50S ribosomal protein L16 3-hydroxylase
MGLQLLGGLSATKFLSRFWQKRPYLIRKAIPGFEGVTGTAELFGLAGREDVEARLVQQKRDKWSLAHGPFARAQFARLPDSNWTLLVQGLNLMLPAADRLLRRFDFIPYARLDDVMLSYAATGGGVGAHVDSYDVFLLQGPGRRRWRLSAQNDHKFDPNAPLRVLSNFEPDEEWVLEPGDMLYLPPGVAHEGTALEPCFTYSIGFRAPARAEMAGEFLASLQENIGLEGLYRDPGLRPPDHPAEIPQSMVREAARAIRSIRWTERDVGRFLGRYLTEPKLRVSFDPPRRAASVQTFLARIARDGLHLDARTQLLFLGREFFINGQALTYSAAVRKPLVELADTRLLRPAARLSAAFGELLHRWYAEGWAHPGTGRETGEAEGGR